MRRKSPPPGSGDGWRNWDDFFWRHAMMKVMTMALVLAAAPLLAHEEGVMKNVSTTARPVMLKKGKALKPRKIAKKDQKAVAKQHFVCPMHDGGESDHAGTCP